MERAYKLSDIYVFRENQLPGSILRVLAYFDVFEYPLTINEIYEYCDHKSLEFNEIKIQLKKLVLDHYIKKSGIYYYLGNESCVSKREQSNIYSQQLLRESKKYSKIISHFPFVRAVFISGSLAKNNANPDADVDYFIIAKANRLWICRTLLTIYKKIFLLNSRKYFCINYFVDTNNLEISDKNIYTATEIAFLLPVYDCENFFRFMAANTWVSKYYPAKKISIKNRAEKRKEPFFKRVFEFLLDNKAGNAIDDICLNLTILYRHLKFRNMGEKQFKNNMMALKGISKHHPHCFQNKVLRKYQDRLISLEAKFGQGLN